MAFRQTLRANVKARQGGRGYGKGGGLRTGPPPDRRRDSFDDRWRDDRRRESWDDGPRRVWDESRSPPRRRSRSPMRGRSRSPRRDWDDRVPPPRDNGRRRDFERDERDDRDDRGPPRDSGRGGDGRGYGGDGRGYGGRGGGRFNDELLPRKHPWHPLPHAKTDWHYHLSQPEANEPETVTLAGVRMTCPPPEVSFWDALVRCQSEKAAEYIKGGIDVDELGGPYGSTPLGWAAFMGDESLVALLLERSANPSLPARKGSYPLHMAVWSGDNIKVVEALLAAGAKADARNRKEETALDVARFFEKLERDSDVEKTYGMDEWRERYSRPPLGRPKAIAVLEVATRAAEEATMAGAKEGAAKEKTDAGMDADDSAADEGGPVKEEGGVMEEAVDDEDAQLMAEMEAGDEADEAD